MRKKIGDLAPGDLVETDQPAGLARVVKVSDRRLLPAIFQHYAGKDARTVDLVMVEGGAKLAVQYHKDDMVETVDPR